MHGQLTLNESEEHHARLGYARIRLRTYMSNHDVALDREDPLLLDLPGHGRASRGVEVVR